MSSEVILVDRKDRPNGTLGKLEAHLGAGHLHRAFSVFVVRSDGAILLQRRASGKMLWPDYWSNSCCSHPMPGESTEAAARRRLFEELGLSGHCMPLYAFEYKAAFGDTGSEHEFCHVLSCRSDAYPSPNLDEVSDYTYLTRTEIERRIDDDPGNFTPWFKMEIVHLAQNFPTFDAPTELAAALVEE